MSLEREAWLLGEPKSIHDFSELGAVDVYEVYVIPVLLGGGIPLFEGGTTMARLRLTDSHVFSNGVLKLVYEPA